MGGRKDDQMQQHPQQHAAAAAVVVAVAALKAGSKRHFCRQGHQCNAPCQSMHSKSLMLCAARVLPEPRP
jgi:hypothetical protein